MNKELVSVIMPVLNAEKYITSSVNSILNQTYDNFEFIIIDDGSSDNTATKIKEISDSRISFYSRSNEGLINQLNFALSVSKGKYIARMDADDLCDISRIEKQVEFLENNNDIQLVGSNYYYINRNGKIIVEKKFPEMHDEIEFMMPVTASVLHSSMLVLRENLININGYDKTKRYAEDHDLFLRLIEHGCRMHNIQSPLYYYRIGNDSEASQYSYIQQKNVYNTGAAYLQKKYLSKFKDSYIFSFRLALLEYYRGDMNKARRMFFKLFIAYPSKFSSLSRYLIVSLLGERIIRILRRRNILSKMSFLLNKIFRKDFNSIQNPGIH
ncbi:MAG: glycosyltransferase [Ignavibacteriaceae bacterium]|nr:glycosyltransferase [Ignavibacteriaceae bacterium]